MNKSISLIIIFSVLGGFSSRAWGYDWYARVGVSQGKGTAYIEIYNNASKIFGGQKVVADTKNDLATSTTLKVCSTSVTASTTEGWPICHATNATGYHFEGWYYNNEKVSTNPNYNTHDEDGVTLKKGWDRTYYAKFTANTYTIAFNKNGATHGSTASVGATYDQDATLTTNGFYKAHYSIDYNANGGTCATTTDTAYYAFAGWKVNNAGDTYSNNATVRNLTSTHGATVNMFAQWGSTQAVTLPTPSAAPAYDGDGEYTFAGWYLSTDEATKTVVGIGGGTYTPTANVTLKAKWTLTKQPGFFGANQNMSVGAGYTGFVFSNTTTAAPSSNPSDKFYYVISNVNVTSANTDGCGEGNSGKVIAVETAGGVTTIRAINKGTAKITFYQQEDATNNIAAGNSATYTFTVDKIANTISCNWDGWSKSDIRFDEEIATTISSNNSDGYAPLTVTQTAGATVARYDKANNKIVALCDEGTATWSITQAEDYKYYAATTKTLSVTVGKAESPGCRVLVEKNQHSVGLWDNSGGLEYPLSCKGDKLYFKAGKHSDAATGELNVYGYNTAGTELFHEEYGVGSLTTGGVDEEIDISNKDVVKIKFKAGNTLSKWFSDVYVSRKVWLTLVNAGGLEISSITLPSRTRTGAASTGTFYIDYSTCADEIKLVSNNSHVKFSANNSTTYTFDVENGTRKTIGLTYTSGDAESIAATITVYTPYERKTLTVNAQTLSKLSTTLEYIGADSYSVDHANINATSLFRVRDQNGDLVASPAITLSSNNTSAINTVSSNTAIDFLCGADNVRITASYAGDDDYAAASNSGTFYHDITVTRPADAITWHAAKMENDTIHVWADNSLPYGIATANTRVWYGSGDASFLEVTNGATIEQTTLVTKNHGLVTLSASSEGNCSYAVASNTKYVRVDPCVHELVWDQSFTGLIATAEGVINRQFTLNAYAIDSMGVRTNVAVNYSLSGDAIASISGNVLTVFGVGDAIITATTAADNKYAVVSESKSITVRRYGEACNSKAFEASAEKKMQDFKNGYKYSFSVPGDQLTYTIRKLAWGTLNSDVHIEASVNGTNWTTIGETYNLNHTDDKTHTVSLDNENYRYIRWWTGDDFENGFRYIKNVSLTQKTYLRVKKYNSEDQLSAINKEVDVNTNYADTFDVQYSDIPLLQYSITNHGSNLSLRPTTTISNDCGKFGTYSFVLSGKWSTVKNIKDTITLFTSAGDKVTIPIALTVDMGATFRFNQDAGTWGESDKWSLGGGVNHGRLPDMSNEVIVSQPLQITGKVECFLLSVLEGGSLTIQADGGLTVGAGGVEGLNASNFRIQSTTGHQSYFRMSPEATTPMPTAVVEYATKSTLNSGANKNAKWQYIGVPVETVFEPDYNTWFYEWSEPNGWINLKNKGPQTLHPFRGYAITQYGQPTYDWTGRLSNRDTTLTLTAGGAMDGENMICNSYAAPIDVRNFRETDFTGGVERVFYLYNSGSWNDWNTGTLNASNYATTTPGHFVAIPVLLASKDAYTGQTLIPSMQGICVKANSEGTIHFDYERLVWNASASATSAMTDPIRTPARRADRELNDISLDALTQAEPVITSRIGLMVSGENSGNDCTFLYEESDFTAGYDNGYDARKMMNEGIANLYATAPSGQHLSVAAVNQMDSTFVGFLAGEDNTYTLQASHIMGDSLYLHDLIADVTIPLTDTMRYTFSAEPFTQNDIRFRIVRRPVVEEDAEAEVVTDLFTPAGDAKMWVADDVLYVTGAPAFSTVVVVDMQGNHVLSASCSGTASVSIRSLAPGIYCAHVDDVVCKFVKK